MNQPTPVPFLSYAQIQADAVNHPIRRAEVPVEHAISLPLPTLRWTLPGYACFAGPARRVPGQPLRLRAPDRWWVLDARRHALLGYALTTAVPFAADLSPGEVEVTSTGRDVAARREDLKALGELVDVAARRFFAGETGDPVLRSDLIETLTTDHLREAEPWYRALTPDFFAWLDG
jgi:hypothetical protein